MIVKYIKRNNKIVDCDYNAPYLIYFNRKMIVFLPTQRKFEGKGYIGIIPFVRLSICPVRNVGRVCPVRIVGRVCPVRNVGRVCPVRIVGRVCPVRIVGRVCPVRIVGRESFCYYSHLNKETSCQSPFKGTVMLYQMSSLKPAKMSSHYQLCPL